MRVLFLIASLVWLGAAVPAVAAGGHGAAEMGSGAVVDAPHGYTEMCARAPVECGAPAADAAAAPSLSEQERRRLIRHVNRYVNARVTPKPDRGDLWQRALADGGGVGDCEDYAIEKHDELVAAGFPPRDLFYAVAYLHGVGLHAVLIARTGKGDVVLDSRTPWTPLWTHTGYVWLARQSADDGRVWTRPVGAARA